jgi:Kef-type K+ transport system membrane component KefB
LTPLVWTRLIWTPLAIAGPPNLRLPLFMLLVYGSAKVLAEIFETLGQPGIVGEILAGVLIGPGLLGWIAPNELLTALSDLGVMFLLFRVGMEVKSSELLKVGGTGFLVAVLGVVIPFFAGWALLSAWGGSQIESIFLGASMVATSVGITAQVLASKGLLSQKASQVILTAAVIDDVLGLLVLAVVSGMARGSLRFLDITITLAIATAFVVIIALWGTPAMRRVVPRMEGKLKLAESEFAFSICLLFALALLATYAGVAAIIGAFLAGMALGESVGHRVHTLVQGATELLAPFFLVGLGVEIKLGVFKDKSVIALALAVFAVAVATKLLGCGIGALRMGRRDAWKVGVGMIPRGEVGMVVARLGLAMGILTDRIYGVVVFMAVATTLIAPPLIKIAFRQTAGGDLTPVEKGT